jgi:eight-cysteine-cluster-containing protein
LLWGGLGCGFEGQAPGAPRPQKPTRVVTVGKALVISKSDPNYSRFELPEEEGECAKDVDCSAAGCSGEVCTTSKNAIDIYTTCSEVHPGRAFFCGCLDTRCQWQKDPDYQD